MDFNLEIRKKQLESLKQYIKSSEENVNAVFQILGWSAQKTLQDVEQKVVCSINSHHLVSKKRIEEHIQACKLRCSGYEINENFLPDLPEDAKSTIALDRAKKIEILSIAKGSKSEFKSAWNGRDLDPLTSDRSTSTFSVDERLALYDYSIKHTVGPPKPKEFSLDLPASNEQKELSAKEKLTLERDAKRRRAKYKSVHTSKKSQTEIMKELIDNQMNLYIDWLKEKEAQELKEKERLKKLAKEKSKHIFDKHEGVSTEQWNQSASYSGSSYDNSYYNTIQNSEGVITDWSHLYQGAEETDYDASSTNYQFKNGNDFVEQNTSQLTSAYNSYSTEEGPRKREHRKREHSNDSRHDKSKRYHRSRERQSR